ncbi:MAG TPA: outer membrane beta-barrel protein [Verrucomicrobiae bacterium]|nr:outer membrane beta-barrel protein [Verrucomicrobiae bacterium]
MKFDKWTVALAALGVVSLGSVARAEEKPSSVMTALSSTTLSGYVDTSAEWNPGTGNAFVPPYKFNGPSKADGFNLDVVQLRIEKPLDEADWSAGYRVDLWAGPDANVLGTQSTLSTGHGDFAIRQAYAALRVPVLNGLDVKVGVFDSIIGYESVESPNDPNFTRSYGHSIEPQTHTGVLASYRFSDLISASLGVANTMGPVIDSRAFAPVQAANAYPESYKTYMASVAITAPDSLGVLAGSTLYGGVVNGFNNSIVGTGLGAPELNAYVGATVATPVTGLRLGVAWDLLNVDTIPNSGALAGTKASGDIWSLAGYASYQLTEKLSVHGRFEYATGDVDQPGAFSSVSGPVAPYSLAGDLFNNGIYATTVTLQYDLWKNVLSRLEFRWDHSEHGTPFGGTTGGPTLKNAFLLAANIVYKF